MGRCSQGCYCWSNWRWCRQGGRSCWQSCGTLFLRSKRYRECGRIFGWQRRHGGYQRCSRTSTIDVKEGAGLFIARHLSARSLMNRTRDSFFFALGITATREIVSPSNNMVVAVALFALNFLLLYLIHPYVSSLETKFLQKIGRRDVRKVAAYEASFISCSIAAFVYLLWPTVAWPILLLVAVVSFLCFYLLELELRKEKS